MAVVGLHARSAPRRLGGLYRMGHHARSHLAQSVAVRADHVGDAQRIPARPVPARQAAFGRSAQIIVIPSDDNLGDFEKSPVRVMSPRSPNRQTGAPESQSPLAKEPT